MANYTATALAATHSFSESDAARLPGWVAPVLGLLLILTGLAISYAPFPATGAKVHFSLTERQVPGPASIAPPAAGSLDAAAGDNFAR